MATTKTAGQQLTTQVAKFLGIGGTTRNRRRRGNVREDITEIITIAAAQPGYFLPERQAVIAAAYTVSNAYQNHVLGGRLDSIVCWYVREGLSPYQFLKLLGRMVDAGVKTSYEAERFFGSLRAEANAAYSARY